MKNKDLSGRLWEIICLTDINQRYHQTLESQWGFWEKSVRVVVASLSVVGLVTSLLAEYASWNVPIGLLSVFATLVLNVVPLSEREKFAAEMFHRWSDLRKDAERLRIRVDERDPEKEAQADCCDRYEDLVTRQHLLNANEPSPDRKLLLRCHHDHNESIWGTGIRTEAQVEAERARRLAEGAIALEGSAAAAVKSE